MYCPKCAAQNHENNFRCVQCGTVLHPSTPPVAVVSDETLGGLIPSKNGPALVAYYLGLFALVPFVGLLLGIPALVLGMKGLKKVRGAPEVKGKIHAGVGIITGGVFSLVNLLLIASFFISR